MPKRKSLEGLIKELEKRKEKLAKEKQKLQALKKKLETEYRKREARFLIAVGRTILKYAKTFELNGQKVLVIPINNQAFKEAFKEYEDIVNLNEDFRKWKKFIDEG
jgi:sugar-specific transcriptional regulator TrmB